MLVNGRKALFQIIKEERQKKLCTAKRTRKKNVKGIDVILYANTHTRTHTRAYALYDMSSIEYAILYI